MLQGLARTMHGHFDRSNFQVEIHQCFLDLVVTGTACLLFEEAPIGEASAFKFTAVPLGEVVMEEGPSGRLDTTFRHTEMTEAQLQQRFPNAPLPDILSPAACQGEEPRFKVLEGVVPDALNRHRYLAVLQDGPDTEGGPVVLAEGLFGHSPLHHLPLVQGPRRNLWAVPSDEGAAGHQNRQQGGGTDAEKRQHRRHRHLAGR